MRRITTVSVVAVLLAGCADTPLPTGPSAGVDEAVSGALVTHDGPPFYAISGNGGFIPHDGTWAAIPFVRPMSCPGAATSNLIMLDFGALGCGQLTVEGFDRWQNGPGIDPAPRQTQYLGKGAVPIVFVRWNELQGVIGDGELLLAELLGLPSAIVGTATFYKETDIYGVSGPLGPGRGMYKISARGTLPGGGTFRLHVNEVLGELRVVDIRFGD